MSMIIGILVTMIAVGFAGYVAGLERGIKQGYAQYSEEDYNRGRKDFMQGMHKGTHPDQLLAKENREGIEYNRGWEDAHAEVSEFGK